MNAEKTYSPKRQVAGALKKFIFIFDKNKQEIGCKFTGTWLEEIDKIEVLCKKSKLIKSTQVSDKGQRPVEMKYVPLKNISWNKFVVTLEKIFNNVI